MKRAKRFIAFLLSMLMILEMIPRNAWADSNTEKNILEKSEELSATAEKEYLFGNSDGITRAEWIHNLRVLFDMTVEDDSNMPDNYFTDIKEEDTYYRDIMLAVEFGVVDIEAGNAFEPLKPATREFAAQTLNYCLGYELDENEEYTYSDVADVSYPKDIQIAVNRGWFALAAGAFEPDKILTESEIRGMIKDAETIRASEKIDPDYDSTWKYTEDVIEIPETVTVEMDQNGTVTILNGNQKISAGDKFAIYQDGMPAVYTAVNVTEDGNTSTITTQEVDVNEIVENADAQGITECDLGMAEPANENVKVTYIVGGTEELSYADGQEFELAKASGNKKIGTIRAEEKIKLSNGTSANLSVVLSHLTVGYKINKANREASVSVNGVADIKCSVKMDAMKEMGTTNVNLVTIPVAGIGEMTLSTDIALSGQINAAYSVNISAGMEYKNGNFRVPSEFKKKTFTCAASADANIGLTAGLSLISMPIVSGGIYAKAGVHAKGTFDTYDDGKHPTNCAHIAAWLYANLSANVGLDFGIWKKNWGKTATIFNESNSPVRIAMHYEEGKRVAKCTRHPEKYLSGYDSVYAADGMNYGTGSYTDAEGNIVPVYTYTLSKDEQENDVATITGYTGVTSVLVIPETVDGYKVVGIGNRAFKGKTWLKMVMIPDSVTQIGEESFAECTSLEDVQLSFGLKELGSKAFGNCTSLTGIEIPKSISISNYPFSGCSNLKFVEFETDITIIPKRILAYTGIEELTLPDTVTKIEKSSFYNCMYLKKINMPDSVTCIEGDAFGKCSSLEEVHLSKKLESIGYYAFRDCTRLHYLYIPKSITNVGYYDGFLATAAYPFVGCVNLSRVEFETGIVTIPSGILCGSGIVEITLPDTVTEISEKSFLNCNQLVKVNMPNSVTSIGLKAFSNCTNLKDIKLSKNLVHLGSFAFLNCESINTINLPQTLTDIGYYDGFTNTAAYPFAGCSGLESFTYEAGVTEIPNYLFANSGLKNVAIPKSIDCIGERAFYGCTNLSEIDIKEGVKTIEDRVFEQTGITDISLPNSIISLGNSIFNGCVSLESVKLPDTIKSIPGHMFSGCKNLKNIELPKSTMYIQEFCFEDSGLENILLPENVVQIEAGAFMDSDIKSVKMSENVNEIGKEAFKNCDNLTKIEIPNGVTYIGANIFQDCDVLTDVTLGTGIITIPSYAFDHCDALKEIHIPYLVDTISQHAFSNCVALTNIRIPRRTSSIDTTAFSYADKMTITGISGTYAEKYAKENNINFQHKEVKATDIALSKIKLELNKGSHTKLFLNVTPFDFTDEVSWKSTDTGIVSVEDTGVVSAEDLGTANIKVLVGDKSVLCTVTVVQPVERIRLDKRNLTLDALDSYTLKADVLPDNAKNQAVLWSSSDEKVASVTPEGVVTAHSKGTAIITVEARDGSGVKETCEVNVSNNAYVTTKPETIESSHPYESNCSDIWLYTLEGAESLDVTFDDRTELEDGFDFLHIFNQSGEEIGKYTGKELAGQTITISGDTIKIQMNSDKAGAMWGFKVADITETGSADKKQQNISGTLTYKKKVGDEDFALDAKLTEGDGKLTYHSSDESVITVTGEGIVSIKGEGTAMITVTAGSTTMYNASSIKVQVTVTSSESPDRPTEPGTEPSTEPDTEPDTEPEEKEITYSMVNLSSGEYNWDGRTKTPAVSVVDNGTVLVEGKDYIVSYESGRKNIGFYEVTVTGIGEYSGEVSDGFNITLQKGKVYETGGLKYKLLSGNIESIYDTAKVSIAGAKTKMLSSLVVKDSVKIGGVTCRITEVNNNAFKKYTRLQKVTLGKNITRIGTGAFYGCKKLKSIQLKGTKLKTVSKNAIKGIYKRAVIKVPSSRISKYKKLFKSTTGKTKYMKITK